jgi:hypothetical protein
MAGWPDGRNERDLRQVRTSPRLTTSIGMFQLDHDKRSATLGSRWSAVWTHTRNLRVRRRRVVTTHGAGGTTTPGTTGNGRLGPLRILLGQSISAQCGSTERLADRSPLYRDRAGGRTYVAIFAPDPSPAPDEMKPLAVIPSPAMWVPRGAHSPQSSLQGCFEDSAETRKAVGLSTRRSCAYAQTPPPGCRTFRL